MKFVENEKEANVILIPVNGPVQYWHRDDEMPYDDVIKLTGIDNGYVEHVALSLPKVLPKDLPAVQEIPTAMKKLGARPETEDAQMLIHEEGKVRTLDFNEAASRLFWVSNFCQFGQTGHDYIVGPALILKDVARWT